MCGVSGKPLTYQQLSNLKLHYQRRYQITLEQWYSICVLYGNACLKCYKSGEWKIINDGLWKSTLHPDHVTPVKEQGLGVSDVMNIQPLCDKCNKSKNGNKYDYRPDKGKRIAETNLELITPPSRQMMLF